MKSRRLTAQCLRASHERIAHLDVAGARAAVRDFDSAYDRSGSNAAFQFGSIATFQDLGCVPGLLDEQQTQRANVVNGVFGKDRTCWQEDRASPMVSP